MSLNNYLKKLKSKHLTLKDNIKSAQANLATDDKNIVLMKKMKLRIKEKIFRMEQNYN